jgi:predicted nucleotidyltransferase
MSLVAELSTAIRHALGADLVGLYLFGSLVLGDFHPDRSDIDLLAAVERPIPDRHLDRLHRLHSDFVRAHPTWEDRVETAYISRDVLRQFRERPGEVVRISPGEPLHRVMTSPHWLMDLYTVRERGLVLYGPPADELLPPIPTAQFVEAARENLRDWRDWIGESTRESFQAHAVLSICRNLYACLEGAQTSKLQGARWAGERYPAFAPLIEQAVRWRDEGSQTLNERAHTAATSFLAMAIQEAGRGGRGGDVEAGDPG